MPRLSALFAALSLIVFSASLPIAHAADHKPVRVDRSVPRLDTAGGIHPLQSMSTTKARVVVFLSTECPIARKYIPRLNELAKDWGQLDGQVEMFGVVADPTITPADAAKFVKEFAVGFPLLMDRDSELVRTLGPQHVPEAFVLDGEGVVAYRGRIDDLHADLGVRRAVASRHDLANAVTEVLAGKSVTTPHTDAVGCLVEDPPASFAKADVTYHRDIAPILFANCTVCHRDGEVGPFPLVSYQDAAKRAKQIVRVVDKKLMPPWMPAQTHGEFIGQRTLTPRQIELLKRWAETDRAEGKTDEAHAMPQFSAGWRLGPPDLVLEMPAGFDVPAGGHDIYQNFVIPIDVPEDKLVAAVDFRPGAPSVVHHAILYLDDQGRARKKDSQTPEQGYPFAFGPGFLPSGSIGGWSPGNTPRRLPDNLGRQLMKGSDLVMQIHYHPTGKAETDRSKVGVYFVDKPKNIAASIWTSTYDIDIPPGENNYIRKAAYTLPADVRMVGIVPHMHLLGRAMKCEAVLPDGARRTLIDVPDWNYRWQDEYYFARPFKLPKGTKLEVEARYDNSADNPRNPASPPKRVGYGEETNDEMLYCFFLVAADQPKDLLPLILDNLRYDAGQRIGKKIKRD